nr:hypothetical protein [Burkholderia ubonensis]
MPGENVELIRIGRAGYGREPTKSRCIARRIVHFLPLVIRCARNVTRGGLTSAFNFRSPNGEPLPALAGRTTKSQVDALPYELHARARAHSGACMVTLKFANTGRVETGRPLGQRSGFRCHAAKHRSTRPGAPGVCDRSTRPDRADHQTDGWCHPDFAPHENAPYLPPVRVKLRQAVCKNDIFAFTAHTTRGYVRCAHPAHPGQ